MIVPEDVAQCFAPDYATARGEFNRWTSMGCWDRLCCPIEQTGPQGEALGIDFARSGDERARSVVVVSSGLHGVEGYFGAAVQLALLRDENTIADLPRGVALVLIHALNPWGFAWIRRTNEANVDLNRNFLLPGEPYEGSPAHYAALDPLLNPKRPPRRFDSFRLRAILAIVRHGMPELKQAIAGGQYAFPRGLFYGGQAPSPTYRLLDQFLPRFLDGAERVLHFDFHTGLGRWATYQLLVDVGLEPQLFEWSRAHFGPRVVQCDPRESIAYQARGDLASWCRARFPGCTYDLLCAEFGTYPALRVLAALRAENQAHFWARPDQPIARRAKKWLLDAFVPPSSIWRTKTVAQSLDLVRRGLAACAEP
jgi:hypothetical protein